MISMGDTVVASDLLNLIEKELVVLDGAMGTMLQGTGLAPDELLEEWNIHRPEAVRGVHEAYLAAGARIIETNTFGASPLKLGIRGKEGLVEEINRRGVECAREALSRYPAGFVGGSVGPTGKILGMDVTPQEADRSFSLQAAALARAGADLLLVETMIDLGEAVCAVRALKRETGLPVFASLSFARNKRGELRTLFGNAPAESALALLESGAAAVGSNCGLVEDCIGVAREMRGVSPAPITLYPNAGAPVLREGRTFFEQSAGDLAAFVDGEIEAGATILGGCCGTTPEYIRLVSRRAGGRKRNP
jgi:5-methyltetrahydrofolate--homocysteine methyltransferase